MNVLQNRKLQKKLFTCSNKIFESVCFMVFTKQFQFEEIMIKKHRKALLAF